MRLHSARSHDKRQPRPYTTGGKRSSRGKPSTARPQSMRVQIRHKGQEMQKQVNNENITVDKNHTAQGIKHFNEKFQKTTNRQTYNSISSVTIKTGELQRRQPKSPRYLRNRVYHKPGMVKPRNEQGKVNILKAS